MTVRITVRSNHGLSMTYSWVGQSWSLEDPMFRSRRAIAIAAAFVVLVPILYALAAGPLVYMRSIGRPILSDQAFGWIYHPLIRAEARIPALGRVMHFYVGFWERAAEQHWQRQQRANRKGVNVESNHLLPPGTASASA